MVQLAQALTPGFTGGAALGCSQEVFERDVQERAARLGQDLVALAQVAVDVDATTARARHACGDEQLAVDVHGAPVAHEDACGHRWEAMPGRDEPARLVERGGDEPAVHEPRPTLVALVEGEPRLVRGDPLLDRVR